MSGADTATASADIVARSLGKTYQTTRGAVHAMAGLDLTIDHGEFIVVIGASGCGKSTFLRILAGFEAASTGSLTVGGRTITKPGPDRGVVFQDYGLFPWLTVSENVAYGPRQRGMSRRDAQAEADSFIEVVGLTRFTDKYPRELSGGMQQRVAIARVLANRPLVMLMDEPFGALDALTRTSMQQELARIQSETGTTVVFVTHSIEEAVFLADRVVVMAGGAAHGVPGHVKEVVTIDLDDRDVTSPAFNAYKRRLATLVHAGPGAAVD